MRRGGYLLGITTVLAAWLVACSDTATTPTPNGTVARTGTPSGAVAATPARTPTAGPTPVVRAFRYACDEGKAFEARVQQVPFEGATLLIEGRTIELRQERAASGVRYSDGTLSYVSKGDEAYIERNGQITYRNCRVQ